MYEDQRPVFERLISKVGHVRTEPGEDPVIVTYIHNGILYHADVKSIMSSRHHLTFVVDTWWGCNSADLFEKSDVLLRWCEGPSKVTFKRYETVEEENALEECISANYLEYTDKNTGFTVCFPPRYTTYFKKKT